MASPWGAARPKTRGADKAAGATEAPTLLASVTRQPPPPARWLPNRRAWVPMDASDDDPWEETVAKPKHSEREETKTRATEGGGTRLTLLGGGPQQTEQGPPARKSREPHTITSQYLLHLPGLAT